MGTVAQIQRHVSYKILRSDGTVREETEAEGARIWRGPMNNAPRTPWLNRLAYSVIGHPAIGHPEPDRPDLPDFAAAPEAPKNRVPLIIPFANAKHFAIRIKRPGFPAE